MAYSIFREEQKYFNQGQNRARSTKKMSALLKKNLPLGLNRQKGAEYLNISKDKIDLASALSASIRAGAETYYFEFHQGHVWRGGHMPPTPRNIIR